MIKTKFTLTISRIFYPELDRINKIQQQPFRGLRLIHGHHMPCSENLNKDQPSIPLNPPIARAPDLRLTKFFLKFPFLIIHPAKSPFPITYKI